MNLAEGSKLGRYEILSQIGAGGMGEVYLAEDANLRRRVALKVLTESVASNQERLRRFLQEAQAASALNHPNILTVYEFSSDAERHYLATEFVEGKTLRDLINEGPLPVSQALDIALQVASALSAAHTSGITHRDIKPENIMIRTDGIVKLLDFGLAKLTERSEVDGEFDPETSTLVKTIPGMLMGTTAYMSPEQSRGREQDNRTDIWSLGVVMFEMLTGHQPFRGETFHHTIIALQEQDTPSLARFVRDYPAAVENIIRRAVEKDPDGRYQSADDMLSDINMAQGELDAQPGRTVAIKRGLIGARDADTIAMPRGAASTAEWLTREFRGQRSRKTVLAVLAAAVLGLIGYFVISSLADRSPIDSIAVLPFQNGSDDQNLDYLSDGLSESVLDKLAQLPQLKVIARSSSFKYRGENLDLQKIAKELGVRAIVTGRVVRHNDDLTIRVEMIDAGENKQLWGEQYVRKIADAVNVQQDIARTVSEKLRLNLSGQQFDQLSQHQDVKPEAYELVLKGKYYFELGGTVNRKKAADLFEQAVAADPNYAQAYANLSATYRRLAADSIVDPREYIPKAEATGRKALELDENLPDAHLTMGNIYQYTWRWADAEREYKRGIELSPNLGIAHRAYSLYLSIMGRHDEALAEAQRAREIDPVVTMANASVGYRLVFARRFDDAIADLTKTEQLDPTFDFTQVLLGYAYAGKGQYADALKSFDEAVRLGDDSPSTQIYIAAAYARSGDTGKAREMLSKLQAGKDYVSPAELAILYAALGDKEVAFASLEKGFGEHDLQLQFLKVDPAFDALREDPRFVGLLQRVGFTS
jgi:serine/threonine protein kinase/Tfp pilus assembly protein PilF